MKSVLMMTIMALIVLLKMMMLDDDDVDDDDGFDGNHLQRNVSANVWRPVMWRANLNILSILMIRKIWAILLISNLPKVSVSPEVPITGFDVLN